MNLPEPYRITEENMKGILFEKWWDEMMRQHGEEYDQALKAIKPRRTRLHWLARLLKR
jgi:hypothetical protein